MVFERGIKADFQLENCTGKGGGGNPNFPLFAYSPRTYSTQYHTMLGKEISGKISEVENDVYIFLLGDASEIKAVIKCTRRAHIPSYNGGYNKWKIVGVFDEKDADAIGKEGGIGEIWRELH